MDPFQTQLEPPGHSTHHNSGTQSILVALFVLQCLQLRQVLFCLLSDQVLQVTSCCTSTTPDYSPQPWSHIAMDFTTNLPLSRGNTVILTIIDSSLKLVTVFPSQNFLPLWRTCFIVSFSFFFFCIPEEIVSDRGTQFISRMWKELCRLLYIKICLTSGYHPQSNEQGERLN